MICSHYGRAQQMPQPGALPEQVLPGSCLDLEGMRPSVGQHQEPWKVAKVAWGYKAQFLHFTGG